MPVAVAYDETYDVAVLFLALELRILHFVELR
jgi:hypothetical protein